MVGVRDASVREKLSFVKGLQALGTYVELARLAVYDNCPLRDIGPELAVGVPLRKANIMPKLRTLAADFALSHLNHLFAK